MMPKSKTPLTPRHQRFAEEFIVDRNQTQAAIRAGFSPRTANKNAARLMVNEGIKAEIARLTKEQSARTLRTADELLEELDNLTLGGINEVLAALGLPFDALDSDTSRRVKAVTLKVRKAKGSRKWEIHGTLKLTLYDKQRAIALAGKHRGLFMDKVEHTGRDGGPIEVLEINPVTKGDSSNAPAEDSAAR